MSWKLKKKYNETWDYEKIRLDVSKAIMQESIVKKRKYPFILNPEV